MYFKISWLTANYRHAIAIVCGKDERDALLNQLRNINIVSVGVKELHTLRRGTHNR